MWTKRFWLDAVERAIRTAAQVLLVGWPASNAILDGGVNWELLAWTAGGAAATSILMSIVGTKTGDSTSASLVPASATSPEPAP